MVDFTNARLKIERANTHIKEIESSVAAFSASDLHGIITEQDPATNIREIKFKQGDELPKHVNLVFGDAVHNLRAALDHAMFTIILHFIPTADPGDIHFPFRRKVSFNAPRNEVVTAFDKTVLKGIKDTPIGGAIRDAFVDLIKPYGALDRPLVMLNELDNIDKHRLLITMFTLGLIKTVDLRIGTNRYIGCTFGNAGAGGSIFQIEGDAKVEGNMKPAVEVFIDEVTLTQRQPLIPTLNNIVEVVAQALDAMERCFV